MENLKGKKIAILTAGSTGDVLPFIALAKALKSCGANPVLSTGKSFQALADTHQVDFVPIPLDPREMLKEEIDQNRFTENFFRHLNRQRKILEPKLLDSYNIWWQVAKTADILIYHPLAFCGVHIAEKLGIPSFMSASIPVITPTKDFMIPLSGYKDLGVFNKLSYKLATYLLIGFYPMTNQWRQQVLGLKSMGIFQDVLKCNGKPLPVLYSYSKSVLPESTDWLDHVNVSGYWFLDQQKGWQPPESLKHFLNRGEPPIYIGFGSMPGTNSAKLTAVIKEVVENSSYRYIIATGWGGLQKFEADNDVFFIDAAPHEWLFPKVSAVIHHGGSGTTAAGLRFAKPSIICPFMLDQFFWSDLLYKNKVIEKPIAQKRLNAEILLKTIDVTLSSTLLQENIKAIATGINRENGCDNAISFISDYIS